MTDGVRMIETPAPNVELVPETAMTPPGVIEPPPIRPPVAIVRPSPALARVPSLWAFFADVRFVCAYHDEWFGDFRTHRILGVSRKSHGN